MGESDWALCHLRRNGTDPRPLGTTGSHSGWRPNHAVSKTPPLVDEGGWVESVRRLKRTSNSRGAPRRAANRHWSP